MEKVVLVTGGLGFIGSHTVIALEEAGYKTLIFDNLSNSDINVLINLEKILKKKLQFSQGDIRDKDQVRKLFSANNITSIIHFAGLKSVGESVTDPLIYYDNNVYGTMNLIVETLNSNIKNFIFSSSATVYGNLTPPPFEENSPLGATNPYGRTKIVVEEILNDVFLANPKLNIAKLRYFNPLGAHPSGLIGENPSGIPNNLMPFINEVAIGKRSYLGIFGADYPTIDGTGIRDYIHVMDLAEGHLETLRYFERSSGSITLNLGTGQGYSVLQLVETYQKISGIQIPYTIVGRRKGDIAESLADPSKAQNLINWKAKRDLTQMCIDSWNWIRTQSTK